MLFRKKNRAKNIVKGFRILCGLSMLFLYFVGNVQIESFHQVFHANETELHSSEHEKDPCHRAIYHDTQQDGCKHETHLTEAKKCPLCHVIPHNQQHLAVSHAFEAFSLPVNFNDVFCFNHTGEIFSSLSGRGPPAA